METAPRRIPLTYWLATFALVGVGVALSVFYAPMDTSMGHIQKVFHLHLPAAVNTLLASSVVFIASIGYIWQRKPVWDDLAEAAARVTAVYCSIVLLTGMMWAHSAWSRWWIWSPRLTFSLVLWLLYVIYLLIRPAIASPQRRAIVCAIYAIVSFLDVPLVYLSVMLLPDVHPSSVQLEPAARQTVTFWFLPVTMVCGGMIWAQFRHNALHRILSPPQHPTIHPPMLHSAAGPRV